MSASDDARRLRRARELFERAQRDNVSMPEACVRVARERWAATRARLAAERPLAPVIDAPEGRELQWWQK